MAGAKTRNLARTVKNLSGGKSVLLAVGNDDRAIRRAAANLARVDCLAAKDLNAYEILNHTFILMDSLVKRNDTFSMNSSGLDEKACVKKYYIR